MEFYFKTIGAKVHLYREKGFFDEDLGELRNTSSGKLKTDHLIKENFELKDLSKRGKGDQYSIKSTKGLEGIIERKKRNSDRYILKEQE